MLRVIGIIALIWIGLMVLGAVFKALFWVLLVGAVLVVGWAGYTALTSKPDRDAIR